MIRAQARGLAPAVYAVAGWPARRWFAALLVTVLTALATGIPTGVVTTSLYSRMTPVTWWDYPFWVVSSMLVGLTTATYVRAGPTTPATPERVRQTVGGTILATFAIGCPICNKLVVWVLGLSGALTYFAPLQPLLGALGVALLSFGLMVRLRAGAACPVAAV